MSASDYGLNADEVERDLVEQIRTLLVQRDEARAERDALRNQMVKMVDDDHEYQMWSIRRRDEIKAERDALRALLEKHGISYEP